MKPIKVKPKPSRSENQGVRADVVKFLKASGWEVVKNHGSAYSRAGWPDLFCYRRRPPWTTMLIETKRAGEEPTELQRREIERITAAGGCAAVVHSLEELLTLMKKWEIEP